MLGCEARCCKKNLVVGVFYMCCSCRFFAAVFGGGPYSAWAVIPALMTFFSDQISLYYSYMYICAQNNINLFYNTSAQSFYLLLNASSLLDCC